MGRASVRWGLDDGDGVGRLTVAAEAGGYAGLAEGWIDKAAVLAFSEAASQFPLSDAPALQTGLRSLDGTYEQELIGIRASQIALTGQIGVHFHLTTRTPPEARPDSLNEVRLELVTSYGHLADFSKQLGALIDGRISEAVLEGESFAQNT